MYTAYTLVALKRRVNNILFHINTNTQVIGEVRALQDVVNSILTVIADLSPSLPYRNDLNRILIYVDDNKRRTSVKELLERVKTSLKTLAKDLEKY